MQIALGLTDAALFLACFFWWTEWQSGKGVAEDLKRISGFMWKAERQRDEARKQVATLEADAEQLQAGIARINERARAAEAERDSLRADRGKAGDEANDLRSVLARWEQWYESRPAK